MLRNRNFTPFFTWIFIMGIATTSFSDEEELQLRVNDARSESVHQRARGSRSAVGRGSRPLVLDGRLSAARTRIFGGRRKPR